MPRPNVSNKPRLEGMWTNTHTGQSRQFRCGWCDREVASEKHFSLSPGDASIYVCPSCTRPTYFEAAVVQLPAGSLMAPVLHLPGDVESLWTEIMDAAAAGCYTAAVMLARKLLMNMAVAEGADTDLSFVEYVQFLADKGYVPPNGKQWVDRIRTKGNEANHEIKMMLRPDAEELLRFSEMLLKFVYEFPNRVLPNP